MCPFLFLAFRSIVGWHHGSFALVESHNYWPQSVLPIQVLMRF